MKSKSYIVLLSFFSLLYAGKYELLMPHLLNKSELYASLATGVTLYHCYSLYSSNKQAAENNNMIEEAIQKSFEDKKLQQDAQREEGSRIEKMLLINAQKWTIASTEQYKSDEQRKKINLLRELYEESKELFSLPGIKDNQSFQNIKSLFEKNENTSFIDLDLDRFYAKLSTLLMQKIKNLNTSDDKNTNLEKKIFQYQSYNSSIPFVLLSFLFWIPTIIKFLGYSIRFGDSVKRFPSLNHHLKEFPIPSFVMDVRTYIFGLSFGALIDTFFTIKRNFSIQKENNNLSAQEEEKRQKMKNWSKLSEDDNDSNNKYDNKVQYLINQLNLKKEVKSDDFCPIFDYDNRRLAKSLLINRLYQEKKEILLLQEQVSRNNMLPSYPCTKNLNAIFKTQDPITILSDLVEEDLDFYHILLLGSYGGHARKYYKYNRPLFLFAISNLFGLYIASKSLIKPSRFFISSNSSV